MNMKKITSIVMVLALVAMVVSMAYGAQLGPVFGSGAPGKDATYLEAHNLIGSAVNTTGAKTAIDLGATVKDTYCTGYIGNASGLTTHQVADGDTATIAIEGSHMNNTTGFLTLGTLSLTNSVMVGVGNTTIPVRYLRVNVTAFSNATSYGFVNCVSRTEK